MSQLRSVDGGSDTRGHWTTRRSAQLLRSQGTVYAQRIPPPAGRNDCDSAGQRWIRRAAGSRLAPSVSAERPSELTPEGHEGQEGRAKPQPERKECDGQDESHWRPPTVKCRPKGEGRVALAGWIRLPLAGRALTAKRADTGGIGQWGGHLSRNFPKENDPAILGATLPSRSLICGFSVRFRGGSPLYGDQRGCDAASQTQLTSTPLHQSPNSSSIVAVTLRGTADSHLQVDDSRCHLQQS